MKDPKDKTTIDAFPLKQRGGKRDGAGRKRRAEPTKVMRIPLSKLDAVLSLLKG